MRLDVRHFHFPYEIRPPGNESAGMILTRLFFVWVCIRKQIYQRTTLPFLFLFADFFWIFSQLLWLKISVSCNFDFDDEKTLIILYVYIRLPNILNSFLGKNMRGFNPFHNLIWDIIRQEGS